MNSICCVFAVGALEVSGGNRSTLAHSGNVISNNDFSDVENRCRMYAPHLHLAGVGAEVSFNHFSKAPSSAMRLEGNDFNIVSNFVEDVVLESDDNGGVDIYFNASYFGNRYCYNTWKNIGRPADNFLCGQAAVRFDGNISGQTVVGNTFIDCGEIIRVDEMFKYNDNGTAPGIFSRMAPMRDNTVIYTKSANTVKRQKLDKRIADGFRILDCSGK